MISHDRHFLNEVCTHTADIDYQSIITYTGAYDEMVLAKTQIRARVESQSLSRHHRAAPAREPAGIPIRETVEHDHGNPAPRRRRRERAARYRSDEKGLHGGAGQTYAPRYPCP